MTLPCERTRAIVYTRAFLRRLINAKETPRIPSDIREEAARLLRHYPWDADINDVAHKLPGIFAKTPKD